MFGTCCALTHGQSLSVLNFDLGKTMKSHELEEEIILASFVDQPLPEHSSGPKKGLIEVLLSPQALQWMMSLGAGFLVIGFGIWLWTIGIFENPLVAAVSVGGINLALIGCGIAMVKATRYQLAGRWLSLLGALAMHMLFRLRGHRSSPTRFSFRLYTSRRYRSDRNALPC